MTQTENKFIGACPFCSTQMDRIEGGIVQCPNFHYKISEKRFDELWKQFSPLLDDEIVSMDFLKTLRIENLIPYPDNDSMTDVENEN